MFYWMGNGSMLPFLVACIAIVLFNRQQFGVWFVVIETLLKFKSLGKLFKNENAIFSEQHLLFTQTKNILKNFRAYGSLPYSETNKNLFQK